MKESFNIENVVSAYIKLRDKKTAIIAEQKESLEKINATMNKLEHFVMEKAKADGVSSFKTKCGTAFIQNKSFVNVENWDEVLAFVKKHDLYHLLTKGVAKIAVQEYLDDNKTLPPGVKYQVVASVMVRRSN